MQLQIYLLGFALITALTASQLYDIDVGSLNCFEVDTKLFSNLICGVKPVSSGSRKKLINMHFNITEAMDLLRLRITVFYKFQAAYRKFFMDVKVDICTYMDGSQPSPTFDKIKPLINNNGPAIHKCPYYGTEGLRNFSLSPSQMPAVLPTGQYRIDMRFANGKNKTMMSAKMYAVVHSAVNALSNG